MPSNIGVCLGTMWPGSLAGRVHLLGQSHKRVVPIELHVLRMGIADEGSDHPPRLLGRLLGSVDEVGEVRVHVHNEHPCTRASHIEGFVICSAWGGLHRRALQTPWSAWRAFLGPACVLVWHAFDTCCKPSNKVSSADA